ncbi:hypothetical protein AAFX91_31670 [Bradyrhizobium sp. 31Argb]|uniref:hypothetical protein n=1 Tax=Bradyrhizobium sp. 31Argb TaxID=3141247 RepID=UPI0037491722
MSTVPSNTAPTAIDPKIDTSMFLILAGEMLVSISVFSNRWAYSAQVSDGRSIDPRRFDYLIVFVPKIILTGQDDSGAPSIPQHMLRLAVTAL